MPGRSSATSKMQWAATAYVGDRVVNDRKWRLRLADAERDLMDLYEEAAKMPHITEVRIDIKDAFGFSEAINPESEWRI